MRIASGLPLLAALFLLALPPAPAVEDCGDSLDNDADGAVDCADTDCCGFPSCTPQPQCRRLRRGDAGDDGGIEVTDAVLILRHIFDGAEVACEKAADADDDGVLSLTDAVHVLRYLFQLGPPPESPFPECGLDETFDGLDCSRYSSCP